MDNGASEGQFGLLLRRYRQDAGLSQEALAERARLSWRTVSDLERGLSQTPQRHTLAQLADALGLTGRQRQAFETAARRPLPQTGATEQPTAVGRAVPTVPLVGRAQDMARIERHLRGQGPPVLLLAGEPGIGKSRLLQEAAQRAIGTGWRVLSGGCQRRGGQAPYAPLLEALQRYIQAQGYNQLRTSLNGCAWLVRLLPELVGLPIEPLPAWVLPPDQERRLMFEAVGRFVTNVAGPAGTVLLLDDLQWAGADGLDLLGSLVRAAAAAPLCVLGAYRDTEVDLHDSLSVLLADLAHAGLAVQHTLAPLERTETAQLVDLLLEGVTGVDVSRRAQAVRRSGGVPFFAASCAQVLRADVRDGGEEDTDGTAGGGELPWSVSQSVRQRVAALPESGQAVLSAAAVIGREVSLSLLVSAAAQPEATVLSGLEAACAGRLLEESDTDAYQFVHDVIREVVEAQLGAARRLVLHRRVAAALELQTSDVPPLERLAYHFAQSDLPEKAVLYLERAGDRAVGQGGLAAAVRYYQDAVQCLELLGHQFDIARVLAKWGDVLRAQAHYDEALVVLERAAQTHAGAGDRESLGRVTAQIGQVLGDRGTPEEGVARVQPLVRQLEEGGPCHALALLHTTLAWLFLNTGQYPAQLVAAERAAALASAVGDDRVRAQAELWRAEALDSLEGRQKALPAFESAATLAEATGDLHWLSHALLMIAQGYRENDTAEADRQAARALDVAERYGNPVQLALALALLGEWAAATGDWGRARSYVERALALDRQVGGSYATAYCLLSIGRLCLMEGRRSEAAQYLEESVAAAARVGNLHAQRGAQRALAECDLLMGRAQAARERLLPLLDRPGLVEPAVSELLPTLAWALLDVGDVDAADTMAGQAVARTRQQLARELQAEALRVQAMVRMRQERWPEARQMLDEGLTLARHQPYYPCVEARLLHVYGQVQAEAGAVGAAVERWGAALAVFRHLGAHKDAERVERDIGRLAP